MSGAKLRVMFVAKGEQLAYEACQSVNITPAQSLVIIVNSDIALTYPAGTWSNLSISPQSLS